MTKRHHRGRQGSGPYATADDLSAAFGVAKVAIHQASAAWC